MANLDITHRGRDSDRWAGTATDGRGQGQMGGDSDRWAGTATDGRGERQSQWQRCIDGEFISSLC